jgi:probable HAF family extracellular repeat protein
MIQITFTPITIPEGDIYIDDMTDLLPTISVGGAVSWSISWHTQDQTATANVDYVPDSGSDFIIELQTLDDVTLDEPNDTFCVVGTLTAVVQTVFGPYTYNYPFIWEITIDETGAGATLQPCAVAPAQQLPGVDSSNDTAVATYSAQVNLDYVNAQNYEHNMAVANGLVTIVQLNAYLLLAQIWFTHYVPDVLAILKLDLNEDIHFLIGYWAVRLRAKAKDIAETINNLVESSKTIGSGDQSYTAVYDFMKSLVATAKLDAELIDNSALNTTLAWADRALNLGPFLNFVREAGDLTDKISEVAAENNAITQIQNNAGPAVLQQMVQQAGTDPSSVVITNLNTADPLASAPTADLTDSFVRLSFAATQAAAAGNFDMITAGNTTSWVTPFGESSPGPASDPSIPSNGHERISLESTNETVVVTKNVTGTIVIDGTNGGNGTVIFKGNYGSYQVKELESDASNFTAAVVTNGQINAIIENVPQIVFDDTTVTFDGSGNPIISSSGTRAADTGQLNYVPKTVAQSIVSGFNQDPYYDPLHGDRINFNGAVNPATASNFVGVPDVVNNYADALDMANSLLQQYAYVAVAYDQGTPDSTAPLQPGQNFLLLFADTKGNHQADAVTRLVGLNNVDQISYHDIATSDAAPLVTVASLTATHGQSFAASSLFSASDPDGDTITQYAFWDTGTGGGRFLLNGISQPTSQEIDVAATQLAQLSYQSGSAADTLWVRVNDGTQWSNWSSAFTVTAPVDTGPALAVSNVLLGKGQSTIAASNLFTYSDPFGSAGTEYGFWDAGAGGGHFLLNGAVQPSNQEIYVAGVQLSQFTYRAGSGADTLWVQANDGTTWGPWSNSFTVSPWTHTPPVVTVSNLTATQGQSFAAYSLFSASDPDGDTISQYAFWDTGTGGAHFVLNSIAQASNQEIDVTTAQLMQLAYQSGSGADTLWVKANDGTQWSNWSQSFTVSRPLPTLTVTSNAFATRGQQLPLSTLVTISDPAAVGYQKLELWDSNGTASGGQFVVSGAPQSGGHEIDVVPANVASTVFEAGTSGGTDMLWAQLLENNGQVTGWQAFTVAVPFPVLAVTSDPSATRGQPLPLSTLISISDPAGIGYQKLELWDSNGTVGAGQFVINGVPQSGGHEIDVAPTDVAGTLFDVGTVGGTDTLWAQLLQNNGQVTGWQPFTVTAPAARVPTLTVSNDSIATPGQKLSLSALVSIVDPDHAGFQSLELWDSIGTPAGGQFAVNGRSQTGGHEIDVAASDVSSTIFDVGTGGGTDTLYARLLQANGQLTPWQTFTVTAPLAMTQWLSGGPVTFTPGSGNRFYYKPVVTFINNKVEILVAYSDPYQGKDTLQPDTYLAYSVDSNGNLSSLSGITAGINGTSPQTVPSFSLNYQTRSFSGSTTGSEFGYYFDTINQDGSATFRIAVVDPSGASPVVHNVATALTINPVPKALTEKINAEISALNKGNSINEEIFEVAGAPAAGTTTGTFLIFDGSGNVVVNASTGFIFTDNKAHVFGLSDWNSTTFGQLVEVWNTITNLADLRLYTINAKMGAVTAGWTAATELQSIARVTWEFISPGSSGMIIVAAGSDTGGPGFFEYVVNDTKAIDSPGGTISKSVAVHYTGTVTQDAAIRASGISNEYVVSWVDGNGLTVELIDSKLSVLETYSIAEANGASTLQNLGDGRLFVDYQVQTPTSSVDKYTILDTHVSQPGPFVDTPPMVVASDQALAQGSTVAASSLFTAGDPDGDAIAQYDFWDSTGNGHFALNGLPQGSNQDIYVTAAQLSQAIYQAGAATDLLYVRANDGSQWSTWKGFNVNVVAVPALSSVAANASFTEEGTATTLSPNLKVTDPNSTTLASATVSITGGAFIGDGDVLATSTAGTSISASYNSAAETLTLSGADTLAHYQSVLDQVTLSAGENPTNYGANQSRTVSWVINDGKASNNLSAVASTTVNITAVNDPPILSSVAPSVAFTAGQTVTLSPNLSVSDPDNLNLASATVSITGGTFTNDGDVLAASTTGTAIAAGYNSTTETLTLSGSDTLAHYRSVLDSITFSSSSQNPTNSGSNLTRTVTWVANDGNNANNLSTPATTTVNISAATSVVYSYVIVDDPSATGSQPNQGTSPFGINSSGQIVGYYFNGTANHGFLDSSGSFSNVDDPSGNNGTFAQGINATGQIVGVYQGSGVNHGFLDSGGSFTTIDDPIFAQNTVLEGINGAGQIVGYYRDSGNVGHGFLDNSGSFTPLDDPNAAAGNNQGTLAWGINDAGQIVGYYTGGNNISHGFLYSASSYTTLDDPLGTNGTFAEAINKNGQIVGYYKDSSGGQHGFVLNGGSYTSIDEPASLSGQTRVTGINDAGQIVGYYQGSTGQHGFVATPTALTSNVTVPSAAILDLTSPYAGTVSYANSTGTLKIETSSSFTGTIAGQLATTDVIDLADISYASLQTPTYSGNNSPGTLTVSDGTHTAHLAFSGNYSLASFQTSNDGKGGTKVIDPPLSASTLAATDCAAPQSSAAPDIALLGNYMASAFAPSASAGSAFGSDSSLSQAQPQFIAPPQHA